MQEAHAITVYVAVNGSDRWTGTRSAPAENGADGPLQTLEKAVGTARQVRKPHQSVIIEIQAGEFTLCEGLRLTEKDSGTPEAPLVIRAARDADVRLLGGRRVERGLRLVKDANVLARLPEAARAYVLELDLAAADLRPGEFHSYGFNRPFHPAMLELYWDGRALPLAAWPKGNGFETIAGFPQEHVIDDDHGGKIGAMEGGFLYVGDRPKQWSRPQDILVHGYWAWDWANSVERIETLDTERRLIRLRWPHGHYGFRIGNRVQYRNILEELSEPGEWVLDGAAGRLYVWPPTAPETARVVATALDAPLMAMDGASDVTVQGLILEYGRSHGIQVKDGRNVLIEHCELRNLGGKGIEINGGADHRAEANIVHDVGGAGITLAGGDRLSLAPAGHVARSNHVHHVAQRMRTYAPAIGATGVGIRIENNLMHDHPHIAVLFWGNEIVVQRNEIHHVCMETGDAGAIYIGRDYTFRGNVVRQNFVHHLGGVGMGTMGVYNDDCVSGTRMEGNVFWKVKRAVFLGGGRDFVVENNLFVECDPAIELDGRGTNTSPVWSNMVRSTLWERLEAMNWRQPPYSVRYPELADLAAFYEAGNGVPPGNIRIAHNLSVGGRWFVPHWGAEESMVTQTENYVGPDPGFADIGKGDFRMPADAAPFVVGFKPIPFESIGLGATVAGPAGVAGRD